MKEVNVTFVTGNLKKKEYLEKLLNLKIKNQKVDLDEIQSMDLKEIVEHKARQAFEIVKSPVLVEDVSLEFDDLGGLPGPFVKYFVESAGVEKMTKMIGENRKAKAKCVFGYFDGVRLELFEAVGHGSISLEPKGENGYGWDKIFIHDGYDKTRAEMDDEEILKTYMINKPIEKVKVFLENLI